MIDDTKLREANVFQKFYMDRGMETLAADIDKKLLERNAAEVFSVADLYLLFACVMQVLVDTPYDKRVTDRYGLLKLWMNLKDRIEQHRRIGGKLS